MSRIEKTQLRLVLNNGIHPTTGATIFKTKTFTNVKTNVTADQLYPVAEALAALQTLPLYSVERVDQSEITAS